MGQPIRLEMMGGILCLLLAWATQSAATEVQFAFNESSASAARSFIAQGDSSPEFDSLVIENLGNTTVEDAWVVVNGKDWSTLEGLTSAILGLHSNPNTVHKKIMTTWAFYKQNIYHYTPATASGLIHYPQLLFNGLGYGFCDDMANSMEGVAEICLGFADVDTRIWALNGHLVPEFFYDQRGDGNEDWHMPDPDIAFFTQGDKLLNVEDMTQTYNWLIPEVFPGTYGEALADIYSSTEDNNVQADYGWEGTSAYDMKFRLEPGKRIEMMQGNVGKYFGNLDHDTPPPQYSNGRIVAGNIISKFPATVLEYSSIQATDGKLQVAAGQTSGYFILEAKIPQILVDSKLTLNFTSRPYSSNVKVYVNPDKNGLPNWLLVSGVRSANTMTYDLATQVNMTTNLVFFQDLKVKVVLIQGLGISDVQMESTFELATRSLPDLRAGENQLWVKSSSPTLPGLQVTLSYHERSGLGPPQQVVLDPALRRLDWQPPEKPDPQLQKYHVMLSPDPDCLWPVQPWVTEFDTSKDSSSAVMDDLDLFLEEGKTYYYKVESIYGGNNRTYSASSAIGSFRFSQTGGELMPAGWMIR
ncbi:MAG: fibronectin type III domain-containing protein [bacterium]